MLTSRRIVRRPWFSTWGRILAAGVIGLWPATADAQNTARPGKWTIEFYGGGAASSSSSSGTPLEAFASGETFVADSGQQSRAVSSWYFGDGAALLNQALAQAAILAGTTIPQLAPLDSALLAPGGSRGSGGLFGVRIGRTVSSKLAIELSLERGLAQLELSDGLKNALQAGSDSFKAAFQGLLATAPVTSIVVTSQLTMPDASNANLRIAGAAKWTLSSGGKVETYLTGGGGVVLNNGDGPSAVLNGRYTFRYFNIFPMDETDRVVVTVTQPKTSLMGIIGAGMTYDFSASSGIRVDGRMLFNSTKDVTSLTAAPLVAAQTTTNVMSTLTSPALQFNTRTNLRSTLSGPNDKLTLFTGSGFSRQVSVTIGIFKRF